MEDVKETKNNQPMCHFTLMKFETADDWPNGQVSFWECQHCGHTKEISRDYTDRRFKCTR